MVADKDAAVRFHVPAGVGIWRGLNGTLAVTRKRFVLDFGRRSQKLAGVQRVTQEGDRVVVVLARLLPHIGVNVILSEGIYTARAVLPRWRYQRFLAALQCAEISPDVKQTWLSSGLELRRPVT